MDNKKHTFLDTMMMYGFRTGSTRFFGEGQDIDYVVTEESFEVMLASGFDPGLKALEGAPDPGYEFRNVKVDRYDVIIVPDELTLSEWRWATNRMMKGIRDGKLKKVLKGSKEYRVKLFELYREMYREKITRSKE